ncbi:MAG TPA: Ltp family lipoprotein [Candidatus Coprosoma intestinipullorum]|uniref:Ltp family lipoprotein n=1 Tax=Candidatus Coprosoma intestinipullorum TaxID=2840752 RepID=A0A9D0ZT53_9FIRM|nr:Ltp family lipoprotein [Candidatus Coprosoma intestinipullorum]
MKKTKICKNCGKEIDKSVKICPECNAKQGLKIWQIILIILGILLVIGIISGEENSSETSSNKSNNSSKNKVTVTDFSTMTKADIDTWCTDNKVKCTIKDEYSDTVAKDQFISQSVEANKNVYENDNITITFSLGKEPTTEQKNALAKAESYSKNLHMSKQAIYDQLTSEYGEQFSAEDAQYAIDNLNADYKANALEKAKSYQENMHMSKSAIYDQLISEYGEQFTPEEAQYAIDNLE